MRRGERNFGRAEGADTVGVEERLDADVSGEGLAGPTAAGRESFGEISTVGSAFGSSACAEVALSRLSETLAVTIASVLISLMKLLAVVGGRLVVVVTTAFRW